VEVKKKTIEDYVAMLKSGRHFSQANYGDGEWSCMLGKSGGNSNGSAYTPEIRKALLQTIKEPQDYFYGTNAGVRLQKEVDDLVRNIPNAAKIKWVWKETFAEANTRSKLFDFIHIIRDRNVMVVGASHLINLSRVGLFSPLKFIEIPISNAFNKYKEIKHNIIRCISSGDIDIILFSAGMTTNVLIYDLYSAYKDKITMIDMGAVFDPYVGVMSRKGYRKPDILQRLAKNLVCSKEAEFEALWGLLKFQIKARVEREGKKLLIESFVESSERSFDRHIIRMR